MSEQFIADTLATKATFYGVRVEMLGLQRWLISVMDKARAAYRKRWMSFGKTQT